MTSKSIRHAQKAYKANPTKENLDVILRSQERLVAQHEIDKHIQIGLLDALKMEKKRRKRGKKLNLCGEEDNGALLYHSSRVCVAIVFEAEQEAKEVAERLRKLRRRRVLQRIRKRRSQRQRRELHSVR